MSTQKTIRYTRKKGKKRFNYECEVISTPYRQLGSRIPKGAQHLETIVEPESVVADNPQSYEQAKDHTYDQKVSATVEIPTGNLETIVEHKPVTFVDYMNLLAQRQYFSARNKRQLKYSVLGPSQLQDLVIVYNPNKVQKVSATVEIPTGNLENVEPESVVVDNTQSYEQPKDHTYNPNSDARKQKTIRSADDLPNQRYGEKEFRDAVLAGGVCIVCDSPAHRLQAAHIIKHEYTKNMHPTIGLPKCRKHQTAYDKGKIIIGVQDDYVVLSRVPIALPIDEIRDRIRYHLEELCESNPEQLEEYLQLQRQYIVNSVEQQATLAKVKPTLEAFVQKTNHWTYLG